MKPQMQQLREQRRAPRRGLTALELVLGLSISAVIGMALMSLTSAAAAGWRSQEQQAVIDAGAARGQAYAERLVQSAQDVGYWSAGNALEPATVVLWANDLYQQDGAVARDHKPQQAELVVMRYDPTAKQLKLYRPKAWAEMSAAQRAAAATVLTPAQLSAKSTADAFRSAAWVQELTLLGNAATTVTGAVLGVTTAGERPLVQLRFDVARGGLTRTVRSTVALRTRDADDDWTGVDLFSFAIDAVESLPVVTDTQCVDVLVDTTTSTVGDVLGDTLDLFGGD